MARYVAVAALSVGVITAGTVVYATDDSGSGADSAPETKIIGGGESTEEYPFVASMQYQKEDNPDSHRCTGSLVDADWVLVAAHCVVDSAGTWDPNRLHLRVGSLDRTSGGSVANAKAIEVHPGYRYQEGRNNGHDLALIQLDTNLSHEPVSLSGSLPNEGAKVREMGWGYLNADDTQLPEKLHELDSTVLDPTTPTCISDGEDGDAYGIREGDFCVDNPGGDSGTCGGDSGGPVVAKVNGRWTLLGVTSRSLDACATSKDIATGVASHSDWINSVIG